MKKTLKTMEVKKLKKTLLVMGIIFVAIGMAVGYADAQISGPCSGCHTMHNSQDGAPMAQAFDGTPLATAQNNLTVSTCLGCHNGQAVGAPIIFGTVTRTAGGTFADTVFTTDQKGHNVKDLVDAGILTTGAESTAGMIGNPPGAEAGGYTEPTGLTLTCAGTLGCHGNHDAGAGNSVTGFHHGTYPNAYRFLRFYDGAAHTDIQGKGSPTWESGGATAANHNVYYALANDGVATRDSISSFCSLCHGDFHDDGDTMSGGVWTRHPTEEVIPAAWDAIGTGVTVDYERNPFAFNGADYAALTPALAYDMPNNPRVACISCHRAHASDEDDALRFTYTDMVAGGGNDWGCLGCHTAQR